MLLLMLLLMPLRAINKPLDRCIQRQGKPLESLSHSRIKRIAISLFLPSDWPIRTKAHHTHIPDALGRQTGLEHYIAVAPLSLPKHFLFTIKHNKALLLPVHHRHMLAGISFHFLVWLVVFNTEYPLLGVIERMQTILHKKSTWVFVLGLSHTKTNIRTAKH